MPFSHLQARAISLLGLIYHYLIDVNVIISFSYIMLFLGICSQVYMYSSHLPPNLVTTIVLICLWSIFKCIPHSKHGKFSKLITLLISFMEPLWLVWLGFLTYTVNIREYTSDEIVQMKAANSVSLSLISGDYMPSHLDIPQINISTNLKDLVYFLFLSSIFIRAVAMLFQRFLYEQDIRKTEKCGQYDDLYLWSGGLLFCLVSFLSSPWSDKAIWLTFIILQIALWFNIIAVEKRFLIGLMSFTIFLIFTVIFLIPREREQNKIQIHMGSLSSIGFLTYLTHLMMPSILIPDVKMDKRWQNWFQRSHCQRICYVLLWFFIEIIACIMCASTLKRHPEWFIMLPIFGATAIAWLSFHLITFITLRGLQLRLTACNEALIRKGDGNAGLLQIMASMGIRHFGLLSMRTLCLTITSTVFLAIVSWEIMTTLTMSLLLLLFPTECLIYSLFLDISQSLGGTCTGYIISTPALIEKYSLLQQSFSQNPVPRDTQLLNRSVSSHSAVRNGNYLNRTTETISSPLYSYVAVAQRPNSGSVTLLPPDLVKKSMRGCTESMEMMNQFFFDHMIHNFGCDFSSSGLTRDFVMNKLRLFFQKVTSDGPRFDTYLLYYYGETHSNGDWALGDGRLDLQQLLKLWLEYCPSFPQPSSRLIIICDSSNSNAWLSPIRRLPTGCVALQTGIRDTKVKQKASSGSKDKSQYEDVESPASLNGFTDDWITWNMSSNSTQRGKLAHTEGKSVLPMFKSESTSQLDMIPSSPKSRRSKIDWSSPHRQIRAAYAVSQQWCDFTFHYPTSVDLERHWNENFPHICLNLLRVVNFGMNNTELDSHTASLPGASSLNDVSACLRSLCSCLSCEPLNRLCRYLRMSWLPPLKLDIGHGFYLVRSPNT